MTTTRKKFQPGDYKRVVGFLRELYRDYAQQGDVPYWLPQRWEYAEYLVCPLHKDRGIIPDWKETVHYWEDDQGELVALICSETPDEQIFILTRPDYRYLEAEMIEFAEAEIVPHIVQKKELKVWARDNDQQLQALLTGHGYAMCPEVEYLNWIDLKADLPGFELPEGYLMHDMVNEEGLDLQKKIDSMTAAFESKTYPAAIYRDMQKGPSYRKEYDLYTTDQNGVVCSF